MRFDKKSLYKFNMPYALGRMRLNGEDCVVGATEDEGPIIISRPPYAEAEILVLGPGGCMSLVSHPEYPGELYAIMGCFLGYKFFGGAVYRITAEGGPAQADKIVDLPFAHRMEIVERGRERYLLLANLSAGKDNPADWSRPGTVYALPMTDPSSQTWDKLPVLEGIHKNHGFLKCDFQGRKTVLISGSQGLFSLDLAAPGWEFRPVLPYEVSEIAVLDLDGDGEQELVTIEPFHGPRLSVYKNSAAGWQRVWEAELNYGHCVLAEVFQGKPSILVSNRAGDKDLLLFQFDSPGVGGQFPEPRRIVVDSGVGAANMLLVKSDGREGIIATNQAQGEMVRYLVS